MRVSLLLALSLKETAAWQVPDTMTGNNYVFAVRVTDQAGQTLADGIQPQMVIVTAPDTSPEWMIGTHIVDLKGNVWTITPVGQLAENGTTLGTGTVLKLAYINEQVYQETSENGQAEWEVLLSPGNWQVTRAPIK